MNLLGTCRILSLSADVSTPIVTFSGKKEDLIPRNASPDEFWCEYIRGVVAKFALELNLDCISFDAIVVWHS